MNNRELIAVNGVIGYGWVSVHVHAALGKAVRSFDLQTTDRFKFPPGTPVEITANGDLVLKGYSNLYKPQVNPQSHPIRIAGRGRGQDFVDCSAIHKKGHFENKKPEDIAKELDHWGVIAGSEIPTEIIEYFQLHQGATGWEEIERALRDQGVVQSGQPDGSIKFTNAKAAKRHAGGIIEGVNLHDGEAEISDDRRFSETQVKGQRRKGTKAEDLRIKETANDSGVKRYRPKLIVAETDTNKKRAKKRAENESNRAQGFSVKANIMVQSWRDQAGTLWTPNSLVYIFSPSLDLDGDLLLETVDYHQDEKHTWSRLQFVHPKAYQGKAGKANKSGKQWE